MYITWEEFKVYFPNVDFTKLGDAETIFETYEEVAEDIIYNYLGKVLTNPKKDIMYACGLIIQHIRALGLQPQDKNPFSVAGISSTPKDFTEIIPPLAQKILDRYREISL